MRIFWTDGSASPNPGRGGWAVLEQVGDKAIPVATGSAPHTTNIKMEGEAIKAAMESARAEPCEIHTDSEFWINVLTKWVDNWRRKKWKNVANLDLVKKLDALYRNGDVKPIWERGHNGTKFNELADKWANRAREVYRL